VLGSTGWLAPEQLTGDPISPATDVHAWGLCVLYAATGRQPFGGATASNAIYRVLEYTPEVPDSIPEPLRALIEAALSKEQTRRPTVERIQSSLAPPKPPPLPPPPPTPVTPTTNVPLTDQWTEAVALSAAADARLTAPAQRSPALAPHESHDAGGNRSRRIGVIAVTGVAIVALAGILGAMALTSRTSQTATPGQTSVPRSTELLPSDNSAPGVAPSATLSRSPSAVPSPSLSVAPLLPTFSVRVNYANKRIPDRTVKDSLAWQVDVCSTDAQLLDSATRRQIRLYANEGGKWSPQKSKVTTSKGGRCGKNGVHVVLEAVEDTPKEELIGVGWSKCRNYRVAVPETKSFAKTNLDMCVQTRADQTA
jgi:serine/threonine protein kinase